MTRQERLYFAKSATFLNYYSIIKVFLVVKTLKFLIRKKQLSVLSVSKMSPKYLKLDFLIF